MVLIISSDDQCFIFEPFFAVRYQTTHFCDLLVDSDFKMVNLNITDIHVGMEDFVNPWIFHTSFITSGEVFEWMKNHGLLASEIEWHCAKTEGNV